MLKQKIKWIKTVTRQGTPLEASMYIKGLDETKLSNFMWTPADGKTSWYPDQEQYRGFAQKIFQGCKRTSYIKREIQNIKKACKNLIYVSGQIKDIDLKNKSQKKLNFLLKQYQRAISGMIFPLWGCLVIDQYLVNKFSETLKKVLNNQNKNHFYNKYFEILTTKTGLINAEKEELELLKIKTQKKGKEREKLLKEHAQKWAWLIVFDYNMKPADEKFFLERMKNLPSKPKDIIKQKQIKIRKAKKEIIRELRELKNKTLTDLSEIIQEFLILRTERTDALYRAYYNMLGLVEEIGRRLRWNRNDTSYLIINEIFDFLKNKNVPTIREIKQRQKHFLILKKGGILKTVSNKKKIERIIRQELEEEKVKTEILRGNTAYPGLVKGRVRLIKTIKDIGKLQKGEILVTSMTTPDMTIVIHKAAAIVTDEGGITCHAAICSRELKIPCIIATKIATKVLKDGDLIEVNAEKGIVKILEQVK